MPCICKRYRHSSCVSSTTTISPSSWDWTAHPPAGKDESPSSSSVVILSSSFSQHIVFKAPVIFFENKCLAFLSRCAQRATTQAPHAILENQTEILLGCSSSFSNCVWSYFIPFILRLQLCIERRDWTMTLTRFAHVHWLSGFMLLCRLERKTYLSRQSYHTVCASLSRRKFCSTVEVKSL